MMKSLGHHFVLRVIFCLLLIGWSASSVPVEEVREDVVSQVDSVWKQLNNINRDGKSTEELFKALGKLLKPVTKTVGYLEHELNEYHYEDALKSVSKAEKTSSHWQEKWSEISVLTSPVDVLYGHFKVFPEMPETFVPGSEQMDFDALTIIDLILKPLYSKDDKGTITLSYMLQHAHEIIVSNHEKDAFSELNDQIEQALQNSYWCLVNGMTPQRVVYGFYLSLLTLDIKEYVVLNFGHMLQSILNGTDSSKDVQDLKVTLRQKAYEKLVTAKSAVGAASPAFWRCDPKHYEEGVTFEQFKELLQGYIENEARMQPKGSCKQTCSDFNFVKARCDYPDKEACYRNRVCTGDLVDCQYVAADATACLANAPRRFDYLDYKKGPVLGKSGSCSGVTAKRDSYWRFLYHCSNCLCLCDDPNSPTTVRHVSLASVTTEILSNKIVTGVRFVMKDGILHIQIEQGVPARNGEVVEGSTEWRPVPNLDEKNTEMVAMLDYSNRGFDLDDILCPENYVVTGARFRHLGSNLNMEIQATQINPLTGQLVFSSSHWLSNDNTPAAGSSPRQELKLDDVDVPTLSRVPSVPDSVHDQFLEFTATSRSKDVAQTTVPFVDIQPVRPNPPVWLQGLGVYHKGQPGYGGFIAPRVFTKSLGDFMAIRG